MSNNGLSTDEKVNLLFKNYMNFTTTSDDKLFYEETILSSNSNIYSSVILTDTPKPDSSIDCPRDIVPESSVLPESGSINSSLTAPPASPVDFISNCKFPTEIELTVSSP